MLVLAQAPNKGGCAACYSRSDLDAALRAELDEGVLLEKWVRFDLVTDGLDASAVKNLLHLGGVEVGEADGFDQASVNELLHLGPRLRQWRLHIVLHRPVFVLGERSVRPVDVLERLWPVNDVQIEVVQLELAKRSATTQCGVCVCVCVGGG
jgi:hypothetical protein